MDDGRFQREHVAARLIDGAANAEGSTSHRVPRSRLEWPLIESTREITDHRYEVVFSRAGRHEQVVRVRIPESDAYQMSYWFRRDACWTLVRRVDESE